MPTVIIRLMSISEDHDDVLANGVWQQFLREKPEVLTREKTGLVGYIESGVSLGSGCILPLWGTILSVPIRVE